MDNFREWLSDNLRYFMLGGVILIIVAVLFFSVRACTGSGKGTSDERTELQRRTTAREMILLLRKMMGRQTTGRKKKTRIPWRMAVMRLLHL